MLPDDVDETTRRSVSSVLLNRGPQPCHLPKDECLALKALKGDESITTFRADKGNAAVVMNKEDYTSKKYDELDKDTYKTLQKAPSTVMNKLNKETCQALYALKKRDRLDQSTWFRIKPKRAVCPKIYGLPKVHKQGVPLRMIADFASSPIFNLA